MNVNIKGTQISVFENWSDPNNGIVCPVEVIASVDAMKEKFKLGITIPGGGIPTDHESRIKLIAVVGRCIIEATEQANQMLEKPLQLDMFTESDNGFHAQLLNDLTIEMSGEKADSEEGMI